MNQRHTMALVAATCTLLGTFPMFAVFQLYSWFVDGALAITFIAGAGVLIRMARGPIWARCSARRPPSWCCSRCCSRADTSSPASSRPPTPSRTSTRCSSMPASRSAQQAVPVRDTPGLLLLATIGIGLVALLVDLAAVGLRRPALGGLPLLALYSVPAAVVINGVSLFMFAIAAVGFIWLLVNDSVDRVRRFGRRFTGEGRDVDVWEPSPLSSAGRRLASLAIVLAVLVPLALPLNNGGIIGGNGSGPGLGSDAGGGPAGPTTVDLNAYLKDQLDRDKLTNLVQVTTNDPAPYYLRFAVADQIGPKGFTNRVPSGQSLATIGGYNPPSVDGVTATPYHASITVLNFNMGLVPLYEQITGLQGLDSQWSYDATNDQVFTRRESAANQKYSIDYVHLSYTPDALRRAGSVLATDPAYRLISVPEIKQVADLVSLLVVNKQTEYDKVLSIYNYFIDPRNGFKYDVVTKPGNSGNDIVDFLNNKQGFCVQYAAALAWLVRQSGYPSRVAFGFTRGSSFVNGVYTLTNINLHAWTEVYFPGFGWVPFDATPGSSVAGSVSSPWAQNTIAPALTAAPSGPAVTEDPRGRTPGASPGGGLNDANGGGPGPVNTWVLVGAAGGTLLLCLLLVPALRRRALARQRRARLGPVLTVGVQGGVSEQFFVDQATMDDARRDAHAAWLELRDTMIDFGVPVEESETPRATAERLVGLLEVAHDTATAETSARSGAAGSGGAETGAADPGGLPSAGSARTGSGLNRTAAGSTGAVTADEISSQRPPRRSGRHAIPVAESALLLGRAEERALYARTPMHPHGLDSAVEAVREALASNATRWQRFRATILPPSVLQRWRIAWIGAANRGVTAAARIRAGLVLANPRRLLARTR